MLEYCTLEERFETEETGPYRSYGLRLVERLDNSEMEVLTFSDISTRREVVDDMARRFTEQQLHPIHLRDVVEDLLAKQ